MSGRNQRPGLSVLRAHAASQIAQHGLRATARAIGMRPFGLQYFLDGGTPRSPTLKKLEDWYIHSIASASPREGERIPLVALEILVRDLPPRRRVEGMRRSLSFFKDLYKSLGTDAPDWLQKADPGN